MDTHYYSVSLATGEHLGFLVTVLESEDGASAFGQAMLKIQPSDDAWLTRPESMALNHLMVHQPLQWQHQNDGIVLRDDSGAVLTRMVDGYFKWQGHVFLVNDISSTM
ncbi:hypothetical protein ADP71_07990 [Vitreoscilla sp. C1]|uniref:HLGFF motif protein n=1 Tax=Vitreoscilla sp. (strain C1) TaxID=96942 RepID=UPI000CDC0294|nr:hypothetical protein [Vitreoscilla sp. C1]AUZ04548.1 hypothetical protein ADP71_07990 [Vitreoscilla sp. C1]